MKLATFLAGSAHASQAFREAQTIPNSHVCGSVNAVVGQNTTLNEQVELGYVTKEKMAGNFKPIKLKQKNFA